MSSFIVIFLCSLPINFRIDFCAKMCLKTLCHISAQKQLLKMYFGSTKQDYILT